MKIELMIDGDYAEVGVDIDSDQVMRAARLNPLNGFDSIGIMQDGQPVVFDRCGNFGYLDNAIYEVAVILGVS